MSEQLNDERAAYDEWAKARPWVEFSDYAWQAWQARAALTTAAPAVESAAGGYSRDRAIMAAVLEAHGDCPHSTGTSNWAHWIGSRVLALTAAARAAEPGEHRLMIVGGSLWLCLRENRGTWTPVAGPCAVPREIAAALAASPTPPTGTSQGEGTS